MSADQVLALVFESQGYMPALGIYGVSATTDAGGAVE